jgi:hypothetical protein
MLSSATVNSERRKVGGGRGRDGVGVGRGRWGEGCVAEEEKLRVARSEKLLTMPVPNITSSKHFCEIYNVVVLYEYKLNFNSGTYNLDPVFDNTDLLM